MKHTSLERDAHQQDFLNQWCPQGMTGEKGKSPVCKAERCSKLEGGSLEVNRTRERRERAQARSSSRGALGMREVENFMGGAVI